jgi:hypothetical protein
MLPGLDLHRALIRGRYSGPAVSAMQHEGVPIVTHPLQFVLANWEGITDELIARIDVSYGVYDGRRFVEKRFEAYLERHHSWGRTPRHLKLDDDTFADACKTLDTRTLAQSPAQSRIDAAERSSDRARWP